MVQRGGMMAAGSENITVANAYVQVMPSAQGIKEGVTEAIMPGMEAVGQQAGEGITGGLLSTLKSMAGPIAGALAALGIGRMLLDIGSGFDDMRDAIIVGTGASGEALEELVGIAEDVATTVPVSFAQAGDFIQDLNTRLGLTGDDLRDVATQLGALQSLVGGVNVETLAGAFSAWGIAAEDMGAEMDYLFSVSQATGISFDSLTAMLEKSAPALQQLGFSFEESANMAGLLDRAGMDAQGMMTQMTRAFTNIADEGGDASQVFQDMLGEMQAYIDAGDTAAAMDIATQLFGTRGATQFLQALEDGTIDMEAFQDAALGAGDGIMGTYEATADWAESLEVLKNKAAVALEPLATFAFDALGAGIDMVTQAFEEIAPVVEPLIETLGAVLTDTVLPGVQQAVETLSPVISELGSIFMAVATFVVNAVARIFEFVVPKFNAILSTAVDVWTGIRSAIEEPLGKARDFIKNAIDKIKGFFEFKFEWPHIPLPHFSITGSANPLDWLTGGLPSIGIEWYAKGGIIDGATLYGVGEKGAELVWPSYEPYLSRFADALVTQMDGAAGTVNNYYIDGDLVAADAALAAALDVVAERVNGRARMGAVRR